MLIGNNKPLDLNKDEQFTPQWMFDRMGIVFDLDVAAPIGGAPYVPARRYYTKDDDGLAQAWEGFVFMNPPYSKPKLWVEKFIAHNNGIALLPFAKSAWLKDIWERSSAMTFIYDAKFELLNGKKNSIFMPVTLCGMGDKAKEVICNANLGRVR